MDASSSFAVQAHREKLIKKRLNSLKCDEASKWVVCFVFETEIEMEMSEWMKNKWRKNAKCIERR